MSDQYQQLSHYYDEFVQKNRDYQAIATHLSQILGNHRNVLDIGIGTGLVVEYLLQSNSQYKITGIDTSNSLLELAKERIGKDVNLYCQSVSELNLNQVFDAAYSRGGAWTFVRNNSEVMLASHILNLVEIQKSFHCVAQHLRDGGLLIISSSNAYGNNVVELEDGIIHKRTATIEKTAEARHAILDYCFYRDETLLGQQLLKLRLLSELELKPILETAGFSQKSIDSDQYHVYVKN